MAQLGLTVTCFVTFWLFEFWGGFLGKIRKVKKSRKIPESARKIEKVLKKYLAKIQKNRKNKKFSKTPGENPKSRKVYKNTRKKRKVEKKNFGTKSTQLKTIFGNSGSCMISTSGHQLKQELQIGLQVTTASLAETLRYQPLGLHVVSEKCFRVPCFLNLRKPL